MLKAIAIVAILIAVGLSAVLVLASTKPDTVRVERSLAVNAPASAIYPLIADFHRWTAWSPYEQRDPAMKRTFGGAAQGKGATYAWDGNGNVGAGKMEILEANPSSAIRIKLDFERPFEARNVAEFTFVTQGGSTLVTWAMQCPAPLLSKVMQVFIDMDRMIGKDFEAGLASLKRVTEQMPAKG